MGLDDFFDESDRERVEELKQNSPPTEHDNVRWSQHEPPTQHPAYQYRGRIGKTQIQGEKYDNAFTIFCEELATHYSSTVYVDLRQSV